MREVTERILAFYQENKRDLPWRNIENPYYTLVSEIMLQQTRVDTVIPYFLRFIDKLPSVLSLAKASEDELMKLWQGLGYYRRAKNLQKAAQMVVDQFQGKIPNTYEDLIQLPGIGDYTAKAILSIAYNQNAVAVDGNVFRVFTRYFGVYDNIALDKTKSVIEEKVMDLFPSDSQSDFMQALMEIGAIICLPNGEPKCDLCPLAKECFAYHQGLINDLPIKTKKEKQKVEEITVFVIKYQHSFWIQKREEKGLLSSLWELPNKKSHLSFEEANDFLHNLGITTYQMIQGPTKRHVFTHIIWDMQSYVVELEDRITNLVSLDTIENELSIPTAFLSFIK